MTSREGASVAMIGFNVLGSARSESARRPPRWPTGSRLTRNSVSAALALSGEARNTEGKEHRSAATPSHAVLRISCKHFCVILACQAALSLRFYLVCAGPVL